MARPTITGILARAPLSPLAFSVRIALAATLALSCAHFLDHALFSLILPSLTAIADTLSDDYAAQLSFDAAQTDMIRIDARLFGGPLQLASLGLSYSADLHAAIHLEHAVLPAVLLFTVLGAWPQAGWTRRTLVLLCGLPAAWLSIALTTPALLAGKIEMTLMEEAAKAGVAREQPAVVQWMLFAEGGGRWLLAIVLALVIIAVFDALSSDRETSRDRHVNSTRS